MWLSEAHRNVETFGDTITQLFACPQLKREFPAYDPGNFAIWGANIIR